MRKPSTKNQLQEFKSLLNRSLSFDIEFLTDEEIKDIFEINFESNLAFVRKLFNYQYEDIKIEEKPIENMDRAVSMFNKSISKNKPILLITDNDSDGSQAQAAMMSAKKISSDFDNVTIEFSQNLNPDKNVHGITIEVVEEWFKKQGYSEKEAVTVMTADNGIQSKDEIEAILEKFPNVNIILTDHHLPSDEMTPKESSRLVIVNPKYKPTKYFRENPDINISGASVLSQFIKNVIRKNNPAFDEDDFEVLNNIERHSNAMDFVSAVLSNYPFKPEQISENTSIRALMNINNSIKSFVDRDLPEDMLAKVKELDSSFDVEEVKDLVSEVKVLNTYSKVLLSVVEDYEKLNPVSRALIDEDKFSSMLANKITNMEVSNVESRSINDNYIEQLRPFVFQALSDPSKDEFTTLMYGKMVDVFKKLKGVEKGIIKEFSDIELMHIIKKDNATLMYPKDFDLVKGLGRKLIMKMYNEVNNGVLFVVTHKDPSSTEELVIENGSSRSIGINLAQVAEEFNEQFEDVEIAVKGHDLAAGLFFKSKGQIDAKKLNLIAETVNGIVDKYNQSKLDKDVGYTDKKYYLVDTTNINQILELNALIRGVLPKQKTVDAVFKLNRSSRFIDRQTGQYVTVGNILKKEQYGYLVLDLTLDGNALILPTEVVRSLAENNFKDYISLSQIDNGALIAQSIVKREEINPENIVKVPSNFKDNESELEKDYHKMLDNDYNIKLDREKLKDTDIIKKNIGYGNKEFELFESLVLDIIDKGDLDAYSILDTEGTGLGAAFCFNIGIMDIKVDPNSGILIPKEEYEEALENEALDLIEEQYLGGSKIRNILKTEEGYIVNREIEADFTARFIKDAKTVIPEPIAQLVGLGQQFLNKYGDTIEEVDKFLYERYKGKNIAFVAHNANYDYGVMQATNLKRFLSLIEDRNTNIMMCDSASFSKSEALGYADASVTYIGEIKEALFSDNEYSDYTLSNIVKSEGDFTFPSIRGDFILKRKDDEYFLIDHKNKVETKLPYTDKQMRSGDLFYTTLMPRNRVKYSVQFLLNNLMIRNMLLDQIDRKVDLVDPTKEIEKMGVGEEFLEFCVDYNFGGSFSKNLYNYINHLHESNPEKKDKFIKALFNDEQGAINFFEMSAADIEKHNSKVDAKIEKEIIKYLKTIGVKTKTLNPEIMDSLETEQKIEVEGIIKEYKSDKISFDALGEFKDGFKLFLEKNRDIYSKYLNNWEYQTFLSVYDPKKTTISKDTVDKIEYQTGLSKDKIKQLNKEIVEYKKKVGKVSDPFYIKELHNNVNEKGDMVIEHFAVLLSLSHQHYNRYSNKSSPAQLNIVWDDYIKFNTMLSRKYSNADELLAINSYTSQQLNNVHGTKNEHGAIVFNDYITTAKNQKSIILKNKYLQADMLIMAEKTLNEVSMEEINKIEDDLNFVIQYNLIKNSKSKVIRTLTYLEKYADYKEYSGAKELFFEHSLYQVEEEDIQDKLAAEEISDELMMQIKELHTYFKEEIEPMNDNDNEAIKSYLIENEDRFIESYKRVYDTIGFFYVSNAKKELKTILDSAYENLKCGLDKTKANPKTMTNTLKDRVLEEYPHLKKIVEKELSSREGFGTEIQLSDELIQANEGKLIKMDVIDEMLGESMHLASIEREKMDGENYDILDMNLIMPLVFLETKKNNPVKEFTNYWELTLSYIEEKNKEIYENNPAHQNKKSRKP